MRVGGLNFLGKGVFVNIITGTRVNLNLKELVGPYLQSESELMILICRRSVNRAERSLS